MFRFDVSGFEVIPTRTVFTVICHSLNISYLFCHSLLHELIADKGSLEALLLLLLNKKREMNMENVSQRRTLVSLPEMGLVAGTRGMLCAGIALLFADRLTLDQRKAVGWTLFSVGAVTTVPIALEAFGRRKILR